MDNRQIWPQETAGELVRVIDMCQEEAREIQQQQKVHDVTCR